MPVVGTIGVFGNLGAILILLRFEWTIILSNTCDKNTGHLYFQIQLMIILATVCILYIITLTLIIFRPEMKSTFHHTLITLAVVDILFVIVLIIDTQVLVLVLIIDTQVGRFFLLIFCFERRTRILESKSSC